ncbi:hypothetical protein [Caulobacter sp. 17J65-9]|uniref:hypothetical protein n=1 Tax=Caulobacter sp. 17J65-9 TaxID=2709382 RepID=UPI0013CACDC8|nr:hypothetical protein [Caulobacter sp. 17J65-9]NEX94986.1 hypothetical protein [Caulobacter sp. 17J65-9]
MKKLAAATAALVLGAAWPELASAAPAAPVASDPATAAKVQAYIAQVALWSQAYYASVNDQTDALTELTDALETAGAYYESGRRKDGAAWAQRWSEEQKQRWDAIQKRFDEIAAVPLPPAPMPDLTARVAKIADTPTIVARYLSQNRALADRMIKRIAATAGGDEKAAASITGEMMDVTIAMIEGENQMISASTLAAAPGHPQRDLMDASRHSNLAMIALLQAEKTLLLDQPLDEAALAARLRQQATAVELSTRSMEKATRTTLAQSRLFPELAGTPLLAGIEKMLATYPESAAAEREIAAAFIDLAARIDAPGAIDLDSLIATGDHIGTLVEKRLTIDAQRRAYLQN